MIKLILLAALSTSCVGTICEPGTHRIVQTNSGLYAVEFYNRAQNYWMRSSPSRENRYESLEVLEKEIKEGQKYCE